MAVVFMGVFIVDAYIALHHWALSGGRPNFHSKIL